MLELVAEIGQVLISNTVQLVMGCILSIIISYCFRSRQNNENTGLLRVFLYIAASSTVGIVLPLNMYGLVIPCITLLALGQRSYSVFPMLVSNALFNMLVPYSDVSFVWRNGTKRVILAFAAGVLIGLALKTLSVKEMTLFRKLNGLGSDKEYSGISGISGFIVDSISMVGIYLIIGVIIDTLFRKYAFFSILGFIFNNPKTAFIPRLLAGYDIVNPYFLLAKNIVIVLMDFIKMSALLVILKPKGLLAYYGYYIAIAGLLSVSAFI
ncbi:MAG: hypothetical protein N3I35_13280 [Clostridia bacterium]|nr:hypothetical protein [Clostridia bacterium]